MDFMERARQQALLGHGRTCPNPIVGAVIVNQGEVVGEGFHAGGPHAEVVALAVAGERAKGATLYCTLEPCKHVGRTGPCTTAIIEAGVSKVVYAVADPTALAGGGADVLRSAGIHVSFEPNDAVTFDNRAWLHRATTGKPYIIAKSAMTLDGKIAASDGSSKWISSEGSREEVASLRGAVDGIITGTGTVLADDPLLTVRGIERDIQPSRIVVGSREIPEHFQIQSEHGFVHVESPHAAITYAIDKGFNSLLVESGSTLLTSFLAQDLVDEWWVYVAPKALGSGRDVVADLGISTLSEAKKFSVVKADVVGGDVRIILRRGSHVHGNR